MKTIFSILICIALVGCQQSTVKPDAESATLDLTAELQTAKAKLADLLPDNMAISRAEVSELPEGKGILFHASPKDRDRVHPSFALFLWPKSNPKDIAYETGEGAHTFRRIGSSDAFRVYYSNPSGFLNEQVQEKFCTKEKR